VGQALLIIVSVPFMFLPFMFSGGIEVLAAISIAQWLGLLYLGIIITGVCWAVFFRSLKELGPINSSIFKLLIPVSGTFFAIVFLKETITISYIGGTSLVLLGLWLVIKNAAKR